MMDVIALLSHLILLLILPTVSIALINHNIETDQYALLAFKSHVFDPSDILTENWTSKVSVCNWSGVTCSSRHHRVVALNVSSLGLQGCIAPEIGNISFLNSLDLSSNNFYGNLPQEMVHLRRLKYINIEYNEFSGAVPSWFGFLPNLQHLSLFDNNFTGPIPIPLFNASKLKYLVLSFNKLEGNIAEVISNLGSLSILDMRRNRLTGNLPVNICSKLPKLKYFLLGGNKISGQIESRFDNCSELQILELGSNNFSGTIPRSIGNLTNLKGMYFAKNFFTGEIPMEIGNLLNLELLSIEYNTLTGAVPKEIGNLLNLNVLHLTYNALSGQILGTILNMSFLNDIQLSVNNFSGSLPSAIGHMLTNLEVLALGGNNVGGVIPDSVLNFTKLGVLDLSQNQFTGPIPSSLGNLRFLYHLNLGSNHFTSSSSREISFLSSLVNCRSLRYLTIEDNPIKGTLPRTLANFSNSLKIFYSSNCEIEGNIPHEIGNLSGLSFVSLANNYLTGPLPLALKRLENLQLLELPGNKIEGYIPHYFCNFRELSKLNLGENQLFGQVPECFGNVTSLRSIFLDSNRLYSLMPASLGRLKDLLYLDISSNSISGYVPQEIGNLKVAISINLSDNKFSGSIPASIGGLQNLIDLSLAHNQLFGSIPKSIENMVSLESLDLSRNNLIGGIPTSMESLLHLKYFNVSFNHLQGEVPKNGSFLNFTMESFMSNEALCGGAPHLKLPPCPINSTQKSRKKRSLVVAYVLLPIGLIAFAVVSICLMFKKKWAKRRTLAQANLVPRILPKRISYFEIQQATNGFSESNLLAIGGYGSIYKGALRDGTILAIKVFNLQLEGAFKSFDIECEVLRNLRHRNLVKVISSCSNPEFKALILEYMPNGSLEKWLYSQNYFLNFLERLDIMIDVASALDYLHHGYSFPVIHCDLKPSNVLLDEGMTGHLSDFGISKFFYGGESTTQTKTLATIGYIAPEYGSQGIVSTSCDVYSFGILLMETFSRKKPTDEMFGEAWGLKEWVADLLQSSTTELIDHNLIALEDQNSTRKVQATSAVVKLSLRCTKESPRERINAIDALEELKKIKSCFLSK